jgi:hypothetical protein
MFRVADLAPRNHALRIELDLHLHVLRRDVQRARELRGKFRRRRLRRVDETVTSVAVARKHFEQVVVVTFPADAEAVERDALFALRLDFLLQRFGIHVAEIGRAVGEQDDAVHSIGEVMARAVA